MRSVDNNQQHNNQRTVNNTRGMQPKEQNSQAPRTDEDDHFLFQR